MRRQCRHSYIFVTSACVRALRAFHTPHLSVVAVAHEAAWTGTAAFLRRHLAVLEPLVLVLHACHGEHGGIIMTGGACVGGQRLTKWPASQKQKLLLMQ